MTDFDVGITARCLGCGRECEMPDAGTATRTLASADDAEFYCDVVAKCAQCGSQRVCVRVNIAMG